jgi:hypothetical protein
MQTPDPAPEPASPANPFALMMDPQSVLDAVEHSQRLARLKRRVYRPLDKPAPGKNSEAGDTPAYDHGVEIESAFDLPD